MVLAEVRYFGCIISLMAAIIVPLLITTPLVREAHLSTAVGFAIYLLFVIVMLVAVLAVWLAAELRKPERSSAACPQARYAPVIVDVLLELFIAYQMVKSFISYRITGRWPDGTLVLVALIVAIVFPKLQAWRRRFTHKTPGLPNNSPG